VAPGHRNPYLADVIEAASAALGIPVREDWNTADYRDGTGFLPLGYYPQTGVRSSSSVAYLHPVMGRRDNLDVLTGTRALRVTFGEGRRATRFQGTRDSGCCRCSTPPVTSPPTSRPSATIAPCSREGTSQVWR
jgi:choline dehydrogenase